MYAIKNNSFRAIASASDAAQDETIVEIIPQSVTDALTSAETQRITNTEAIRTQGEAALADLRAYRDLASPTSAQTLAVVKLMCRVCIGMIRLQLGKLDGAD